MRKGLIMLAAAMSMLTLPSAAAQKKGNVLDVKQSITDNSIVYPESFETDTQALLEGWYMKNYTATDDRYRTSPDPNVSDELIIERLKNIPSVIEMPFNQVVRKYIDRYAKNGRSLVTACLGLGNYYLPIIEQALEAEGLPLELKYLPMIESAFNPNAVSRAGATGLWQFMLSAAKGYDMEVSSLVDERRDPYESSKKGAKLLKDLYNTYGRWDLAIAAYNCGPGNVNKAIRRAGGDPKQHDFWSIYNYLPSETRGYFPMFVAANYIMNYYQDHNISPVVPTKPLVTDTVAVRSRVNLNQIAKVLDLPLDELRLLNPQYRADVIPGTNQRQYMLILPSRQIAAYIMSEDDIKGYNASQYARRVVADPGSLAKEEDLDLDPSATGADNLVAQQPSEDDATDEDYRMVREASRQKEEDDRRRAAEKRAAADAAPATASNVTVNSAGQTVHKVVAGEDLNSIARQHHVSVDQLKIWNNLKRSSVRVGQQLVIKGGQQGQTAREQSTSSYDEAPAQAAPAAPAAKASRRSSRAQATQASNAQAAQSGTSSSSKKKAAAETKTDSKTTKSNKKSKKSRDESVADDNKTAKSGKKGKKTQTETKTETSTKSGKKNKKGQSETKTDSKTAKSGKKNKKTQTAPAQPTTHEVKGGESLEKIAKKNGVSVEELRKANKQVKGDMIRPGDKVNIPKKSKNKKTEATKTDKSGKDKKSTNKKSDTSSKSSKTSKSSKSSSSKSSSSKKKKK